MLNRLPRSHLLILVSRLLSSQLAKKEYLRLQQRKIQQLKEKRRRNHLEKSQKVIKKISNFKNLVVVQFNNYFCVLEISFSLVVL